MRLKERRHLRIAGCVFRLIAVMLVLGVLSACTGSGSGAETEETKTPSGTPVFSESEAFRTGKTEVTVTLQDPKDGAYTLYYTLDGSSPKTGGKAVPENGTVKLPSGVDGVIAVRPLRVIARYEDGSFSEETVRTYFLGAKIGERFDTKVISISVEPEEFYGPNGIYTNYEERGRQAERGCYFEILSPDGETLVSQHSGIRIHGGWTRARSMKSLRIYAREEYDPEHPDFDYPVFPGATDANGAPVTKYKRFVLRNSGNDFNQTFIRDALAQTLAKEAGFSETEEVCPAAVFINGKYQGLYWLQEYVDEHYFESKFGAYKGEFEKSEHKELAVDTAEENLEFPELAVLDLTKEENFAKVRETVDLDNYLFYYAINTILDNEDWPQTNSISYRYVPAKGEAKGEGVFDGRWRFMIHDEDMILGLGSNHPSRECLKCILDPDAVKHHSETLDLFPYSPLFAALMQREDMRKAYTEKVKELVNGVFSAEHMEEVIRRLASSQENELRHYFSESPHKDKNTFEGYLEKLEKLKQNAAGCRDSILSQIQDLWGLQ